MRSALFFEPVLHSTSPRLDGFLSRDLFLKPDLWIEAGFGRGMFLFLFRAAVCWSLQIIYVFDFGDCLFLILIPGPNLETPGHSWRLPETPGARLLGTPGNSRMMTPGDSWGFLETPGGPVSWLGLVWGSGRIGGRAFTGVLMEALRSVSGSVTGHRVPCKGSSLVFRYFRTEYILTLYLGPGPAEQMMPALGPPPIPLSPPGHAWAGGMPQFPFGCSHPSLEARP